MFTPVIILNSSPAIWGPVPMPGDAMLSLPGLALAYAINSGIVLAGTEGCMTIGIDAAADSCDRRNVSDEVEIELVVERCVDRATRDQE